MLQVYDRFNVPVAVLVTVRSNRAFTTAVSLSVSAGPMSGVPVAVASFVTVAALIARVISHEVVAPGARADTGN